MKIRILKIALIPLKILVELFLLIVKPVFTKTVEELDTGSSVDRIEVYPILINKIPAATTPLVLEGTAKINEEAIPEDILNNINSYKELSIIASSSGIMLYMLCNKISFKQAIKRLARHELTHVKQIRYLQRKFPEFWMNILVFLNIEANKISSNLSKLETKNKKELAEEYYLQPLEYSASKSEEDEVFFKNYNPENDKALQKGLETVLNQLAS